MAELMQNLRLILVRTKFPENIGSCARASANFGPSPLYLVAPECWDLNRALPLATCQAEQLLRGAEICNDLAQATHSCCRIYGTTARLGGWRQDPTTPRKAAADLAERLINGEHCALVFGPEDRGLSNEDLEHCSGLVHIPASPEAYSLNLAQAVLILLYECHLALPHVVARPSKHGLSRKAYQEEKERLFAAMKRVLIDIDFLRPDNPDYFFLPLARFFNRADLHKHEVDLFLGICRQIARLTDSI